MTPTVASIITVGTVIGAALVYIGGRYATRSARAANREERDSRDLAAFRSNVEQHIPWDNLVASAVRDLRSEVNELRQSTGKPARSWEPIPAAPPLFPHPERKD